MKFKKYSHKANDKVYGLMTKAHFIGYTSTVKQAEEIINRIYYLGSFKECTEVVLNKEIVKLVMKDSFVDTD